MNSYQFMKSCMNHEFILWIYLWIHEFMDINSWYHAWIHEYINSWHHAWFHEFIGHEFISVCMNSLSMKSCMITWYHDFIIWIHEFRSIHVWIHDIKNSCSWIHRSSSMISSMYSCIHEFIHPWIHAWYMNSYHEFMLSYRSSWYCACFMHDFINLCTTLHYLLNINKLFEWLFYYNLIWKNNFKKLNFKFVSLFIIKYFLVF